METIKFKHYTGHLKYGFYGNGRTAIELIDSTDGDVIAVASVNLVDEELKDDEIAIKDYAENTGMLKALIDAEVVSEPIRLITKGYVEIPICKLLKTK